MISVGKRPDIFIANLLRIRSKLRIPLTFQKLDMRVGLDGLHPLPGGEKALDAWLGSHLLLLGKDQAPFLSMVFDAVTFLRHYTPLNHVDNQSRLGDQLFVDFGR